jgi:hypothetical protein
MIPSTVFRDVAEQWLGSFEVREEGFVVLGLATGEPPDTWRKRLSFNTYAGRRGNRLAHGWYAKESLPEEKVDAFLTAIGRADLWHTPELSPYLPEPQQSDEDFASTCVDCGTFIDWRQPGAGVMVEVGQVVNVRRSYRWFSLCPVCTSNRFPIPEPVPDAAGRLARKIPNAAVHRLYVEYQRAGVGMKLLCEREYERFGYKNAQSMMSSLFQQWERAGWPMRGRSASKSGNVTNGHVKRRVARKIPEATLRKLHKLHQRHDVSLNQMGRDLHEKLGYRRPQSCAVAISAGWKALGLKARDRIEMTVAKSTTNGLSPRNWKDRKKRRLEAGLTQKGKQRRYCTGTTKHRGRKGERCSLPAMKGSQFCQAHAPEKEAQRREITARMRANSPIARNTVPVGLILPDLLRFKERYGRYRVLAELAGFDEAMLYRQAKRSPDERMMNDTYLRLRDALDRLLPVALPAAA